MARSQLPFSGGEGRCRPAGLQFRAVPVLPIMHSGREREGELLFGDCFSCSCSSFFPFQNYEIKGMNSSSGDLRPFNGNICLSSA